MQCDQGIEKFECNLLSLSKRISQKKGILNYILKRTPKCVIIQYLVELNCVRTSNVSRHNITHLRHGN